MRICVISSDINKFLSHEEELKKIVSQFTDMRAVGELYITGYSWPDNSLSEIKAYPLKSRSKLSVKLPCFFLKNIDKRLWLPTFISSPALWVMRDAFIDTIASLDPDMVIITGIRWQKELAHFVRKMLGSCVSSVHENSFGVKIQIVRNYNPSIKVSIVLPTYNGSRYIKESIDSCLSQTHSNIELVVVDDASTDNTPDIVNSYDDKRIIYIRHQKNLKLPHALNTGFAHTAGDYLTWTSDDNLYGPDAIKTMLSFLYTYKKIDFVYAGQYAIDESRNVLRYDEVRPIESLKISNPVGGCFLYARNVAETVGRYNTGAFLAEDLDYWIRVSKSFHVVALRRPLYYYRYHKDSLTSKYALGEVSKVAGSIRENHNLFPVK